MENRRKGTRGKVNIKVTFRNVKSYLSTGSCINDISETGISMPLNLNFPVDSLLEVRIRLNDLTDPIKTLARVVRVSDRIKDRYRFNVSLEFLDFPSDKRNTLRDYIQRSLSPTEGEDTQNDKRSMLREHIKRSMSQAEILGAQKLI